MCCKLDLLCCGRADCRVFLLKFANYLSTGLAIQDIAHRNMGFFRLKLAIEFIRGRAFL